MVETSTQHTDDTYLDDGYAALMLDYAAGNLDEAQSMIVAAHVALRPSALNTIRKWEDIGGAYLSDQCAPTAMTPNSLNVVLRQIENDTPPAPRQPRKSPTHNDISIARLIADGLSKSAQKSWRKLMPGFRTQKIDMPCKSSRARYLQADPGVETPHHEHRGIEITLVLDGAFEDESGRYSRGDLIISDEHHDHTPVACKDLGCVCMVVSSKPIKMTGWRRLLNPFVRI